jgi:hypothetical protein
VPIRRRAPTGFVLAYVVLTEHRVARLGRCSTLVATPNPRRSHPRCPLVNRTARHGETRSLTRNLIMSASHHPTDIHRRQQRKKKRNKLRARIAAAPASARAALEAKVQRTYSLFHTRSDEKQTRAQDPA